MGDEPPRQSLIVHAGDENVSRGPSQVSITAGPQATNVPSAQTPNMEFDQYSRQPLTLSHFAGPGAMDMSNMAAALPGYQMRQFQQPPYAQSYQPSGPPGQSMIYQYQQGAQFAGQTAPNFNPSIHQQYPSPYVQGNQTSKVHGTAYPQFMGASAGPQSYPNQPFMLHQQGMVPNFSSSPQHQHQQQNQFQHIQGGPAYPGMYGARMPSGYQHPQMRLDPGLGQPQMPNFHQQPTPQAVRRTSSTSSLQTSALRGPPRKPKQSGHALWVGNLPPGTHIIDLKDHFSKDATEDIESVFLISKSNCAFVNYKTEAGCTAAMTRFHDSRFQGARLVCRLRRAGASPVPATPGPSARPQQVEKIEGDETSEGLVDGIAPGQVDGQVSLEVGGAVNVEDGGEAVVAGVQEAAEPQTIEKVKEKFFVVKSLTVEDLERSVASGIWATQAHNESALNRAYQASENVYLIFSANKSGEYFGYARMETAIDDESAATIDYQPRPEAPEPSPSDLPLTIPTPATATAPKGRIIDDSARGTIFWEADVESKEKEDQQNMDDDAGNISGEGDETSSPVGSQTFGKPFKIRWMSTDRLPFYRTRGLRNPWNANREVKIARDGTEIEPLVGRRLVNMFHRNPQMPAASPGSGGRQPHPPPPPHQHPHGPAGGFMSPGRGSGPASMHGPRSY